jgi:hypothetical protein
MPTSTGSLAPEAGTRNSLPPAEKRITLSRLQVPPSEPGPALTLATTLRESAVGIHGHNLAGLEEGNGRAVRRPEWIVALFATRQRARRRAVDIERAHPDIADVGPYVCGDPPPVGRDRDTLCWHVVVGERQAELHRVSG